jgi:hypothetical protein
MKDTGDFAADRPCTDHQGRPPLNFAGDPVFPAVLLLQPERGLRILGHIQCEAERKLRRWRG